MLNLDIEPLFRCLLEVPVVADSSCGVLSAASSDFFPGIQLLALALRHRVECAVVNLGLREEEVAWSRLHGVRIVDCPKHDLRGIDKWHCWLKPVYIACSPFEYSLWVDADAVIVGDLNPIFTEIQKHDFFCLRHWDGSNYHDPNPEALYERFPVRRRLKPNYLNSGVIGISKREANIMVEWLAATRLCIQERNRKLFSYWDEGTLHWAIERTGQLERVLDRPSWNSYQSLRSYTPNELAEKVKRLSRGKVIVHGSGNVKAWTLWGDHHGMNASTTI